MDPKACFVTPEKLFEFFPAGKEKRATRSGNFLQKGQEEKHAQVTGDHTRFSLRVIVDWRVRKKTVKGKREFRDKEQKENRKPSA